MSSKYFFILFLGLIFSFFVSPRAFALCVNQEKANLRQGPGMRWPKTWEVIRYMPLKKISKKDGWYRVSDIDERTHWVREDMVSASFSCAAIRTPFANLRKGPGLNFPMTKAAKGDRYLSFRILKTRGRWIQVEDIEGDEVWIARENLWIQ